MLIRYHKFLAVIAFGFVLTVILCACTKKEKSEVYSGSQIMPVISTTAGTTAESLTQSTSSSSDIDTYIILDNEKTTINGYGASFESNTLSITEGGTYYITGVLTDGKIFVNSMNETKKVKLFLGGVSINCFTDAPLYIENSPDETVLILQSGSKNYFSDTARQLPDDTLTDYATAAIYSKDDLQIEGDGELIVTGNFNKGIFSKNDIDIHGGLITVTSADDAIRGKDSVEINAGTLNLTCGGDGIRTSETVEEDKGNIEINGGNITITSELDGIQATYVTINGGEIKISGDDDGIHGDENVTVNGGTVIVTQSYEGIESRVININSGELTVTSSDDGFNAASPNTSEAEDSYTFGGARGGERGGMWDYDASCVINMTGGFALVMAQGDGIDSNGSVNLRGGKMIVFGPTNDGNGALDYGGSFTVSGGTLLATGSRGMAQSVTGDGVEVLNFNINGCANTSYAITDSKLDCKISFNSPKEFQNVVFASDRLSSDTLFLYSGGTVNNYTSNKRGICFDGVYSGGALLCQVG